MMGALVRYIVKENQTVGSCRLFTYTTKAQTQIIADYFESTYNIKWNVVKADGASND
jgi:UTP-glucose-1-phosphate uridylyltransferase